MNVLFLTTGRLDSIEAHSIYPDLLRAFRDAGHTVYAVSPYEKRVGLPTELREEGGAFILHVRIGNITKCGLIEKGISTLMIEGQYKAAIKKHFRGVKFDLVLYSTPPITLVGVINYVKKRDGAGTYLLLKDIFPQNAVDLGMMKRTGVKGVLYSFFRRKEKKLYSVSDYIGCMSEANCRYVLRHNPEISPERVEECPNCIEVRDLSLNEEERIEMRKRYGIPTDKRVFVYGGNLGKPQGIPSLIECLRAVSDNEKAYFLIVGDGTEYERLERFFEGERPDNMKLMKRLPKEDYDRMVAACDVGLIFLDSRFTIPNFPSRLLAYMQAGLPVLAATDENTDVGRVIEEGGFGGWCLSSDAAAFSRLVGELCEGSLSEKSKNAVRVLNERYTARRGYEIIINSVKK